MWPFQKNADNLKANLRIKGDLLFFLEKYLKKYVECSFVFS